MNPDGTVKVRVEAERLHYTKARNIFREQRQAREVRQRQAQADSQSSDTHPDLSANPAIAMQGRTQESYAGNAHLPFGSAEHTPVKSSSALIAQLQTSTPTYMKLLVYRLACVGVFVTCATTPLFPGVMCDPDHPEYDERALWEQWYGRWQATK